MSRPVVFDQSELAEYLGVHYGSLSRLISKNDAPPHFLRGKRKRWLKAGVDAWIVGVRWRQGDHGVDQPGYPGSGK